jgi:hypothetical protein
MHGHNFQVGDAGSIMLSMITIDGCPTDSASYAWGTAYGNVG